MVEFLSTHVNSLTNLPYVMFASIGVAVLYALVETVAEYREPRF